MGSDLGSAIRSFRKGLQEDETADKKLGRLARCRAAGAQGTDRDHGD